MAYSVPDQWEHADVPTAAKMNKYSDSLNAINSWQGLYVGFAIPKSNSETLYIIHKWRWLWYMSTSGGTATIVDPSGVNDDVTLADATSAMTVYDLSNVSWLVQGAAYKLTGFDYVSEDYES